MPFYKDAMSHGNLYIKFFVQFPKKGDLKDNQLKELQKVSKPYKETKIKKL